MGLGDRLGPSPLYITEGVRDFSTNWKRFIRNLFGYNLHIITIHSSLVANLKLMNLKYKRKTFVTEDCKTTKSIPLSKNLVVKGDVN